MFPVPAKTAKAGKEGGHEIKGDREGERVNLL